MNDKIQENEVQQAIFTLIKQQMHKTRLNKIKIQ